jgi:hypothetical protein
VRGAGVAAQAAPPVIYAPIGTSQRIDWIVDENAWLPASMTTSRADDRPVRQRISQPADRRRLRRALAGRPASPAAPERVTRGGRTY